MSACSRCAQSVVGADTWVGPRSIWPAGCRTGRTCEKHSASHTSDYASPGAYFVTITTNNRESVLGSLNETSGIDLSDAGRMIQEWWNKLPVKFPSASLDAHATMPDHLHGIVLLRCTSAEESGPAISLSRVIQWFKTMTTSEYFRRVQNDGWARVDGRLWQRGFYDHVIRSERDLEEIRGYIEGNPGALWERYGGRTHRSAPTDDDPGRTHRSAPARRTDSAS